MAKSKPIYKVYGDFSSPIYKHTSIWEVARFIVYALRDGDYTGIRVTKENN